MQETRKIGRIESPPGFPHGRLAAGELAALLHRAQKTNDYLGGATYGLPPERQAEINRIALDIGRPPASEEWIIHIAAGHSARVMERIPGDIETRSKAVEDRLRNDFSTRMSLLAGLDREVAEATASTEKAKESALDVSISIGKWREQVTSTADSVFAGLLDAVKASGTAHARSVLEPFAVTVERRTQTVAVKLDAAVKAFETSASTATGTACDEIATSCDAAADRFSVSMKGALKRAVSSARKIGRDDRTFALRAGIGALVFVLLTSAAGYAGFQSGRFEVSNERAGGQHATR